MMMKAMMTLTQRRRWWQLGWHNVDDDDSDNERDVNVSENDNDGIVDNCDDNDSVHIDGDENYNNDDGCKWDDN